MLNNHDKVSIVIPAYNVEKYIFKTIKSTIEQSYRNIEIVIVNDGSTDNTLEVIKYFEKQDDRVILIDQDNRGVSSARNAGLENARGEYVLFLDGDDWLEPTAVERLLKCKREYADYLVTCNCYFANYSSYNQIVRKKADRFDTITILEYERAIQEFGNSRLKLCSACYKLFDLNLIRNNAIYFDETISHGEDGLFVFCYMQKCKGIISIPEELWTILERPASATTGGYNKKWLTAVIAAEKMIELNTSKTLEVYLKAYCVSRCLTVEGEALRSRLGTTEDLKYLRKKIRENILAYVKKNRSWYEKLYCLVLSLFPVWLLKMKYNLKYKERR